MTCKKTTAKRYTTRPSPPFHAGDCKGVVKQGNDGRRYQSSPDARGIYKWVAVGETRKASRSKPKATYDIHDNGGRPFRVMDMGRVVHIYVNSTPNEDTPTYTLWKEVPYQTLFIAKDAYQGNSLLVKLAAGRYLYIGHRIYEFKTLGGEEVLEYRSPVGNSDVPYPWARTASHTYLMIEDVVIENTALPKGKDPYQEYYKIHSADMCRRGYGRTPRCEEYKKPAVKEFLKALDAASKRFSTQQLHKRLW